MPGKIKTRIICARNLPIMDRSSDSSDAFVEVKMTIIYYKIKTSPQIAIICLYFNYKVRFGANHYDKTPVFKKSLDPQWNSRFVFEVEEDEIQEEPLLIR